MLQMKQGRHYAKQNKPHTEGQILPNAAFKKNLNYSKIKQIMATGLRVVERNNLPMGMYCQFYDMKKL